MSDELMSGVRISLGGLGGLGVVLLGLALASERFGDRLLYAFCVVAGMVCIAIAIITRVADYLRFRNER